MFRFEGLEIWQEAVQFASDIFDLALELPKQVQYSVGSQIRSSALSISNNIAEGSGSYSKEEFKSFLNYSIRSVFETASMLIVCKKKQWLTDSLFGTRYEQGERLARKITKFRKSL